MLLERLDSVSKSTHSTVLTSISILSQRLTAAHLLDSIESETVEPTSQINLLREVALMSNFVEEEVCENIKQLLSQDLSIAARSSAKELLGELGEDPDTAL